MINLIRTHFTKNYRQKAEILKLTAHIGCLLPVSFFIGRELARWHGQQNLAAVSLSYTGYVAVWLLLISLMLTPLNILFGWKKLLPLRKPIGLYAFVYSGLHLLLHWGGEMGWNSQKLWLDIQTRPAALLGAVSLFILLILALTSFPAMMRLLGKGWKKLHRTVYFAAILAVGHWILVSQLLTPVPVLALILLSLLLLIRANRIKSWLVGYRKNRKTAALQEDSPVVF